MAGARFLVDGMLVRLGKYLRCVGYDTTWQPGWSTHALVRRAADEERVLLTRNTRLGGEIPPPPRWLALKSDDPVAQLREVERALGLELAAGLFTRCIRCNVELRAATQDEVLDRVLAPVRERHRRFFTCPSCLTVFWYGSHVANTCRKLGLGPPQDA